MELVDFMEEESWVLKEPKVLIRVLLQPSSRRPWAESQRLRKCFTPAGNLRYGIWSGVLRKVLRRLLQCPRPSRRKAAVMLGSEVGWWLCFTSTHSHQDAVSGRPMKTQDSQARTAGFF